MTQDQKFLFDLRGWIVLPAVLTDAQTDACKRHLEGMAADPPKLPPHERNTYSGPCQELLDHPALVAVLREIIAPDLTGPEWTPVELKDRDAEARKPSLAYGFRCDNSFHMVRRAGQPLPLGAHNGGPAMGPSHHYQFVNGRIFSPATRVVWELNEVQKDGGGTPFLSGSHKSNYNVPPAFQRRGAEGWESYACPAGSVVIFSENVCHGSAAWTDPRQPRMAIFNHYTHYCMRFHRTPPPPEVVEAMPPLRRTLFRDVWMWDRGEAGAIGNAHYARDNRARAAEA